MTNKWQFEVVDDLDVVWAPDHLSRWQSLLDRSKHPHVFFHPLMVKAWMGTYLPIRNLEPIFVWGRDKEGHEAFMPLVLWKKNWKNCFIRTIVPVGYSDFDYHDPLSDTDIDDSFYTALIGYLKSRYNSDEIAIDGIRDCCKSSNLDWRRGEICPKLSLEDFNTEADLFAFLKTSMRGDIRRQLRRLSEIGEVRLVEYKATAEVMQTFAEFMRCHALRWPNAYKAPHLHENLVRDDMLQHVVHFSSLNVGDRPIAWHLGFEYDGVYYYYMPAGDPEFANFSPVKVHLFKLIVRAIERGDKIYDHLRGDENYKQGWSNSAEYVNAIYEEVPSVLSSIKRTALNARKRIVNR